MAKFSAATTMVMTATAAGSTTVNTIGAQGRDLTHDSTMSDANATGYGDSNQVHVKLIADGSISFDLLLDDTTLTLDDLLVAGASITFTYSPAGTAAGKRKVTGSFFVSKATDSYPLTGVAVRAITLMPTAAISRTTNP